jgi:hypothetical protein
LKASSLVVVVAAVALLGCTASNGPSASATRLASPSPTTLNAAETKAADLRTHLDLLLGEQVIAIAKASSAGSRPDEFASYLHLLTSNGTDLTELVRSALGDTAASGFDPIWTMQNDSFVNYTIGLVTHNKTMSDNARSSLITRFVPKFSQFFNVATGIPLAQISELATQHVLQTRALLDGQFAQNYPRTYSELRIAYAQASRIGDALAPRIALKFPDKFPGNANSEAVDLRVSLNSLLQENAYLATMTTSAATGGRVAEQAAAAGALAGTVGELGTLFAKLFGTSIGTRSEQVWAAGNAATVDYAEASTATAKQGALLTLRDAYVTPLSALVHDATGLSATTILPAIQAQVEATVSVLDEQHTKSPANLGADDRAAGAAMQSVADLIAIAAVTRLRMG